MIKCYPWKFYRGEIQQLCVSAQCLFAKRGLPWDILEIELKNENWLLENESLWEVLQTEKRLKQTLFGEIPDDLPFDDTWSEEDYQYFYNNL